MLWVLLAVALIIVAVVAGTRRRARARLRGSAAFAPRRDANVDAVDAAPWLIGAALVEARDEAERRAAGSGFGGASASGIVHDNFEPGGGDSGGGGASGSWSGDDGAGSGSGDTGGSDGGGGDRATRQTLTKAPGTRQAARMSAAHIDAARAAHQARAAAQFAHLKRLLKVVVAGILLALGLRSFFYEPFNIPSESMLPTLIAGDYLFVAKFPYGIGRYSLPLGLPLLDGPIGGGAPRRGDIVVFKSPRDNRTDVIKRIAGVPGDVVRMRGGQLEIDGRAVPKRRVADMVLTVPDGRDCTSVPGYPGAVERTETLTLCRFPRFVETLDGRDYAVLDQIARGPRDDTALVTVPPGSYFVLGDNRDDSADSRFTVADGGVGLIPEANLIGRADRVFLSIDATARRDDPASWLRAIRWARVGTRL